MAERQFSDACLRDLGDCETGKRRPAVLPMDPRGITALPTRDQFAYGLGVRGIEVTREILEDRLIQLEEDDSRTARTIAMRHDALARETEPVTVFITSMLWLVAGLTVFALALIVDYAIISEFWTRVLSNEFMELPPTLADNVVFKSAQVVFATLALHYILKSVGRIGRGIFIGILALLTIVMLLGFGFLVAQSSLPEEATLFGVPVNERVAGSSTDATLAALGLIDADAARDTAPVNADAGAPFTASDLRTYETLIWLASIGLVFLIVTGIGALSLHYALYGLNGIFGGKVYHAHGFRTPMQDLYTERLRADAALAYYADAKARHRLMHKHIADFVTSYYEGFAKRRGGLMRLIAGGNMKDERLQQLEEVAEMARREWSPDFVAERLEQGHMVEGMYHPRWRKKKAQYSAAVGSTAESRQALGV
jgi:hypothetical protein